MLIPRRFICPGSESTGRTQPSFIGRLRESHGAGWDMMLGNLTTTLVDAGAGNVVFGALLNGGSALTVNSTGSTTFTGPVGGSTALLSLTTDAMGTTAINGGSVVTSGNQTFNDAVTLGQATTFTTTTGGNVTFAVSLGGGRNVMRGEPKE